MAPCESTAEEVSFQWSHHRISSIDSNVKTTLNVSITVVCDKCRLQTGTPVSLNSALVSLNNVPVSLNSAPVGLNSVLVSLFTVSSQ